MTEVKTVDINQLHQEVTRIWDEINSIKKELKERSANDLEIREKLLTLELRFGNLQTDIIKKLDEYREDQKSFLALFHSQIDKDREERNEQFKLELAQKSKSEDKKWKLIWILIVVLCVAAGWDILGVSKLFTGGL